MPVLTVEYKRATYTLYIQYCAYNIINLYVDNTPVDAVYSIFSVGQTFLFVCLLMTLQLAF